MAEPDRRTRNRILIVLFAGVLMGALDIAIVAPALPALGAYFSIDERAYALTVTVYVLFSLIGTPLMAKLSDIHGRRNVYAADVALFALGSLVVALAPSYGVLLAGRAIQGFGTGGIFPVASAVIGDTFPVETRGRALGLIGAVFGLAFLLGPIVGGILLTFSWRWLFLINLPIAALIFVASLRVLPTTRPDERQPFDWPGMLLLAGFLAALAVGVNRIDTASIGTLTASTGAWAFILIAGVFLLGFVAAERRAVDPVLHLSLFSSRQVVRITLIAAGAGMGEAAVQFVPALLIATFGVTYRQASFMLLPIVLAMAIGAPVAGWALDRIGSRIVILTSTALLALGMISVGAVNGSLARFYLSALLVGLALAALLGAPLRYVMLAEAPRADRAAAQGALSLSNNGGLLVGSALLGAVIASLGGSVEAYASAYLVVGAIAVGMAVLAVGLKSRSAEMASAADEA